MPGRQTEETNGGEASVDYVTDVAAGLVSVGTEQAHQVLVAATMAVAYLTDNTPRGVVNEQLAAIPSDQAWNEKILPSLRERFKN